MIYVVKWGEHLLNGNVLSGNLITNILYFRDVIDVLRVSGYTFITKCREGILFKDVESHPDILLKEDKSTEVTGEFFLFYDHLPEHIRKEIKIYINKTEE